MVGHLIKCQSKAIPHYIIRTYRIQSRILIRIRKSYGGTLNWKQFSQLEINSRSILRDGNFDCLNISHKFRRSVWWCMCRLRPIPFDTLTARKSTNQKYYYCILLPPLLIKIHASECEQKREKRRKRQTGKHTHTLARFNISGQISNYVCAVKHTIAGRDSFLFLVLSVLFLWFLLSLSLVYVFEFSLRCIHSLRPKKPKSNLPIFIGRQSQSIYTFGGCVVVVSV